MPVGFRLHDALGKRDEADSARLQLAPTLVRFTTAKRRSRMPSRGQAAGLGEHFRHRRIPRRLAEHPPQLGTGGKDRGAPASREPLRLFKREDLDALLRQVERPLDGE